MSFASVLNSYCDSLDCTNAVIAHRCGISASALSRYRSGDRVPTNSDTVGRIAGGIAELSRAQNPDEALSREGVYAALEAARKGLVISGETFGDRVNRLMEALGMRNAETARQSGIDPSYLSRIRSGQRTPLNREGLADMIAHAAARRCLANGAIGRLVAIMPLESEVLEGGSLVYDPEMLLADDIKQWLLSDEVTDADVVDFKRLLAWFDRFDFAAYTEQLKESVEMPEMDLSPRARFCYGIDEMQAAELEFLDIAAFAHSPVVYLTSDTPIIGGMSDEDFIGGLIYRVELIVRRGGSVNVIHNVERPVSELVAIMSDWVPLYMTGHVIPLHVRGLSNRLFNHVNHVCDACALSAESIVGHLDEGRHYLSLLPEDVAYYQRKMELIVEKAERSLEVFLETRPGDFDRFEAGERERQASESYREVCAGEFENLRVMHMPGDCAVISFLAEPKAHFVIKDPRMRYAISLMN